MTSLKEHKEKLKRSIKDAISQFTEDTGINPEEIKVERGMLKTLLEREWIEYRSDDWCVTIVIEL